MELWIRSQDGEILEQVKCLRILKNDTNNKYSIKGYYTSGDYWVLGQYRTNKRCKEVLDEIEQFIVSINHEIYQMPEE